MHKPHFAGCLTRWQLLCGKSGDCILWGFQQSVSHVYRMKEGWISIQHPFFSKFSKSANRFFENFLRKKKVGCVPAILAAQCEGGAHPPANFFFSKSQKIDLRFSRILRKKGAESKSNPPSFDMHGPHSAGSLPRWQLLHVKSAACILGGFQQDVWYAYRTKEGCISILHPFLVNLSKSANLFFKIFKKKNLKMAGCQPFFLPEPFYLMPLLPFSPPFFSFFQSLAVSWGEISIDFYPFWYFGMFLSMFFFSPFPPHSSLRASFPTCERGERNPHSANFLKKKIIKKKLKKEICAFHRVLEKKTLNRAAPLFFSISTRHTLLEASQDGNFCVGKAEIASCEASSKVWVMYIEWKRVGFRFNTLFSQNSRKAQIVFSKIFSEKKKLAVCLPFSQRSVREAPTPQPIFFFQNLKKSICAFREFWEKRVLNRNQTLLHSICMAHTLLEASQDGNFCMWKAQLASWEASSKMCGMHIEQKRGVFRFCTLFWWTCRKAQIFFLKFSKKKI